MSEMTEAAQFNFRLQSMENLFDDIPETAPQELFKTLLKQPGIHIERIVSFGQSSPEGEWYEQQTAEWVVLLQGTARLEFQGRSEVKALWPGDYVNIPAGVRHRVAWTSDSHPTVWLAIHYGPNDGSPSSV